MRIAKVLALYLAEYRAVVGPYGVFVDLRELLTRAFLYQPLSIKRVVRHLSLRFNKCSPLRHQNRRFSDRPVRAGRSSEVSRQDPDLPCTSVRRRPGPRG